MLAASKVNLYPAAVTLEEGLIKRAACCVNSDKQCHRLTFISMLGSQGVNANLAD